jgi:hypothetical protein
MLATPVRAITRLTAGGSPNTGIRWLCVKPTADERNSTFRKRIVYGGRVYWCKR